MIYEKSFGVKVELKDAEKIRRYLSSMGLIRGDLKIKRDKSFVYIPIGKKFDASTWDKTIFDGMEIMVKKFKKMEETVVSGDYRLTVSGIPEKLRRQLPTSYDVIGDIILVKLPEELIRYRWEVGKAMLAANKRVKVVCLANPVSGEFRTRKVEIIAGEERTETIHREYGLRFLVDVCKTYFSPRLASERRYIAGLVEEDEIVVDMFCGVAPFSIMIAKYAKPKIVYAIDKNTYAVWYAKQNIRINNVLDRVEVIYGDAKVVCMDLFKRNVRANRIIMNLPFYSHMFFSYALKISCDGCTIHFYDVLRKEQVDARIKLLMEMAEREGFVLKVLNVRKIKTYAPREFYMGIDIRAMKKLDADVA